MNGLPGFLSLVCRDVKDATEQSELKEYLPVYD